MGRRRLAYTVRKFNDGFYVLLTIAAEGSLITEIERRLRVSEPVIKFITVRMDEEEKRLAKVKAHRETHVKRSAIPVAQPARSRRDAAAETPAEAPAATRAPVPAGRASRPPPSPRAAAPEEAPAETTAEASPRNLCGAEHRAARTTTSHPRFSLPRQTSETPQ